MTTPAQFGIEKPRLWARVSGVCWLLTVAGGVFAEGVVKSKLIVEDDVGATLRNIFANEPIYRFAITAEFAGTALYLVLTAILYLLLAPVSRPISLIAAFFSVAGCAIWLLNVVNNFAPLALLTPAGGGSDALRSMALAQLRLGDEALLTGMLCFGVHCLLLGYLIARSTFMPWPIGVLLAVGGAGYLVSGFAHIAAPELARQIGGFGYMPGQAGEVLAGLWLALAGVNPVKWAARASS